MSYLEPVGPSVPPCETECGAEREACARDSRAEHPGETAAAVLAGALAARAVSRYSAEKALTAASERISEMGRSDASKSVEGRVVRVVVSLFDYKESQADPRLHAYT